MPLLSNATVKPNLYSEVLGNLPTMVGDVVRKESHGNFGICVLGCSEIYNQDDICQLKLYIYAFVPK